MIDIVAILGGLGNQMFDYAFFLSLKKKKKCKICLIDIDQSVDRHFGLEIFKIFNTKYSSRYKFYIALKRIFPIIERKKRTIRQINSLNYDESIFKNSIKIPYYYGYWQSEKYFKDIETKVRKSFSFKLKLISNKNLSLAKTIRGTNSVSIHVRRGDYLMEIGWDTCNLEYYNKAIKYIEQILPHCTFYVFSDDILWCMKNLTNKYNFIYVDWNKGNDSWQDMYLMSQCKHNIIANSTFSWWGAWLNNNPQKIVITPSIWFNDRNPNDCDIIPDNWIKM